MHSAFQGVSSPSHGAQQVGQGKFPAASLRRYVVKILAESLGLLTAQSLALPEPAARLQKAESAIRYAEAASIQC